MTKTKKYVSQDGSQEFTQPIIGITPTELDSIKTLATKEYVDNNQGFILNENGVDGDILNENYGSSFSAYINGAMYSCGFDILRRSVDGIDWNTVLYTSSSKWFINIFELNGSLYVIHHQGNRLYKSSNNGLSWDLTTDLSAVITTGSYEYHIIEETNWDVSIGNYNSLIEWNNVDFTSNLVYGNSYRHYSGVASGNGVVVASYVYAIFSESGFMRKSISDFGNFDGYHSWTEIKSDLVNMGEIHSIIFKNNTFIAVGTDLSHNAYIQISTDGITWTNSSYPIIQNTILTGLTSNSSGSFIYACSDTGVVLESIDNGTTWSIVYSNALSSFATIVAHPTDDYYIALSGPSISNQGSVYLSSTNVQVSEMNLSKHIYSEPLNHDSIPSTKSLYTYINDYNYIPRSQQVEKFVEDNNGSGQGNIQPNSSAIIDGNGQIKISGDDRYGNLGMAANWESITWTNLNLPVNEKPESIYMKYNNTYILTNLGNVYGCGLNNYNELGLSVGGTTHNYKVEKMNLSNIKKLIVGLHNIQSIYVLTTDGKLYGAGYNYDGRVFGSTHINSSVPFPYYLLDNVEDALLLGYNGGIGNGTYPTGIFLYTNGTVGAVGYNGRGLLGNSTTTSSTTVTTISGLSDIIKIKGSSNYASGTVAALSSNGNLYTWGYNGHGQVGQGNTTDSLIPYLVSTSVLDYWIGNSANTVLFVKKSNGIYACGYNGHGQLGVGDTTNRNSLTLTSLPNINIEKIFISGSGTCACIALTTDGEIYACGYNGYGVIGNGSNTNATVWEKVSLPYGVRIVDVKNGCGDYGDGIGYVLLKSETGELYGAGYNSYGTLHEGSTNSVMHYSRVKL